MKKTKILLVVIITIILSGLIIINYISVPFNIDENLVNNSFNNEFVGDGNLAIVDNKLYYNYDANDDVFLYGLYKIGGCVSSRISWNGMSWSPGNDLHSLQVYKNNLLLDGYQKNDSYKRTRFDGKIYRINTFTNSIELLFTIKDADKNGYEYYKVVNDKIFVFSKDKIYLSTDGENVNVIFDGLSDLASKSLYERKCYISDGKICYLTKDGHIQLYDYVNKKTLFNMFLNLKDIDTNSYDDVYNLIVHNDKIFITVFTKEYYYEVYDVTNGLEKIYSEQNASGDYSDYTNCYKNFILMSSESRGIDLIDTDKRTTKKIVKKDTRDVYVLGDKWIYYVDKNDKLNRTTYDGKITEKVFG